MHKILQSAQKRLMHRTRLVVFLSALFASLCVASIAVVASQLPSAAGSGQCADTILTFSAVTHNSGLITGIAQQHDVVTGVKTAIDVTCIKIIGPNKARIGGTFTRGVAIGLPTDTIVFDVVDNGEGSKASGPDEFNKFRVDPCGCDGFNNPPTFPSERGNIQVRGSLY